MEKRAGGAVGHVTRGKTADAEFDRMEQEAEGRRIGAEAIVKSLVERGALGMVTTHDLALAHIAEALPDRAVNLHFADTLENGALHFDYRLHPGVVQRSNALELMRSVGLPL